MRVLVSTTAGLGHFGPLIPFARAFQRAGHEVLVAAPASFAAEVGRAGFSHWAFADAPPEEWGAVMARLPALSYDEAEVVVLGEVFAGADVRAGLPGVLAAVEEWRPDLVLRETAELASHLAAERFAVRELRVAVGLAIAEDRALEVFAEALEPVRNGLGLESDAAGDRLRAAPWCTAVPALLEHPEHPGPTGAHRCRAEDDGRAVSPIPSWWPDEMSDLPLVYLTFGTVAATVPAFAGVLPAALRAVADAPVRLLATIGQGGDPAVFAGLPANVHVERWVPQADVLAHASAVICHGGFGSVMGPLAAGVPLVVAPQFADQPYNAERVAAVGAGVALPLGPPDPAALREALTAVLAEARYRDGAAGVAAEIAKLPPVDEVATRLGLTNGKAADEKRPGW